MKRNLYNSTIAARQRRNDCLAGIALVAFLIVAAFGWFKTYVQPNDALLHATMECVSDRGSYVGNRAVWDECYTEKVASAGGIVPALHGGVR
jgi:hypothetical protein